MQVISLAEGAVVGRLDDFQFDLSSRQIYGWRLKGVGMFSRAGGVSSEQLRLIGRDVCFIKSEEDVEWTGGRTNSAGGRAWASSYHGMSVMSRRGSMMGGVRDFVIDVAGDMVTGLILHGNRLLILDEDVQTGPDVIIARSSDLVVELPEEDLKEPWWARIRAAFVSRKEEAPLIEEDPPEET
jgi:uncharacterized protein YrrD